MILWNDVVKARRPAQKMKGKRKYRKRVKKTKSTSLMETDTTTTESDTTTSDDDTEFLLYNTSVSVYNILFQCLVVIWTRIKFRFS